ncbi:hypothetical protein IE53DRAFT_38954 [Violaceomyces palustris]|uniref:Uncharacterized protein n=1 Tax=Violaceomyces palustris TaxID=1673888 RepID=A0ACD0P7Q2_9BASI|nr:hypothetical protein IE53DRAFT_38954 [Violaceomyces palustris]
MCCGPADWKREEVADHKFDFIDVRDYHTNGVLTRFRYAILFALVVKSIAVYIADIYTAVTLLAFGHFSGNIYDRVQNDPENKFRVPINYGKWIFFGCIIFSFLLLAYEAHKSRAIVRSRDISYAYTNVMANNYYSLRSYDHFCFFSQINNSKKKKDEFAFFIFFTFKGWKRLLVADGPRQVINGFTLYGLGAWAKWSTNPNDYYQGNIFTAIMILTMLFTVVVFAASIILLIIASVMYIPLLCYIKGNLKEYCCHKIDKRISELVKRKKKKRLAKQALIARKEAAGDFSHLKNKKGEIVGQAIPQPTLPKVDVDLYADEKPLKRSGSVGSSTAIHVNALGSPAMGSSRGFANGSSTTLGGGYGVKDGDYGSTADLIANAGPAGGSEVFNGAPGLPPQSDYHGQLATDSMLSQLGPIGTSPQMFAQRVGGAARAVSPEQQGYYAGQAAQQGSQRALLDAFGSIVASPVMPSQRFAGSSPLNPNGYDSQQQSPYQQAQRVKGTQGASGGYPGYSQGGNAASGGPFADQGLDYPTRKDAHGVEGLDYPPPGAGASDLSSYVPYNGANLSYESPGQTFDDASASAYSRNGNQTTYDSNTRSFNHSPDPGQPGYEDVYDAYMYQSHSHTPEPNPAQQRRDHGHTTQAHETYYHEQAYDQTYEEQPSYDGYQSPDPYPPHDEGQAQSRWHDSSQQHPSHAYGGGNQDQYRYHHQQNHQQMYDQNYQNGGDHHRSQQTSQKYNH